MSDINLREMAPRAASFLVKVFPKKETKKVVGLMENGGIKVHLKCELKKDVMNGDLEQFMADEIGVQSDQIGIVRGHTSKVKTVVVRGLARDDLRDRLSAIIPS